MSAAIAVLPKSFRCFCRHVLAVRLPDGRYETRHKGRTVRGAALEIVCDDCGRLNQLDKAESDSVD